jgi:hypothetical protein
VFVESEYVARRKESFEGPRLYDGAPPVMPHPLFMRETCIACHTGPGARPEIRTSHPERRRCAQCHVEAETGEEFVSTMGAGMPLGD